MSNQPINPGNLASKEAIALTQELQRVCHALMTLDLSVPVVRSFAEIIDRYLRQAREEGSKEFAKSLDAIHPEYIQECAEKAAKNIVASGYGEAFRFVEGSGEQVIAIICEAFGCKPKDECREAWDNVMHKRIPETKEWEAWKACWNLTHTDEQFRAAWKIAKGEK